jgi:hypothetical protein
MNVITTEVDPEAIMDWEGEGGAPMPERDLGVTRLATVPSAVLPTLETRPHGLSHDDFLRMRAADGGMREPLDQAS